jgi:glycosyltransferase involved in cell wall biosynthesis
MCKKGLVTFGPRQSLTSFKASISEFASLGISLDLVKFSPRWFSSPKTFLYDTIIKRKLQTRRYNFLILNSGASLMLRPKLFTKLILISTQIDIKTFVLWRNAFVKFHQIEEAIGSSQFTTLVKYLENRRFIHCAISEQTAKDVRRLMNINMPICVYNCQTLTSEALQSSLPDDPPMVLNVGSVGERKAPEIFVRVAEEVNKVLPSVKFTWIGADAPRHIKAMIREKRLEERLSFLRYIPEPYEYMKRCSLFFLSSSAEGFGLVVAEAMACSRTVFCFEGTGAAEVPGDTGVILPAADVDETARRIIDFLTLPTDRRVNHAARDRYIQMFSPEAYALRWEKIIHSFVDET